MEHQLITVADEEIQSGRVVETLESRLKKWLYGKASVVGLVLRPEQEANIELLDWLESWTAQYQEKGKQLVVIAGTADQFDALELSHPEQCLSYFPAVEEWVAFFPERPETPEPAAAAQQPQQQAVSPPLQPPARPVAQELVQHATQEKSDVLAEAPLPETLETPQFFPTVEAGGVVEISGEYECLGCGANRTWLKGDVIEACDNVECLKPKAGWKLSCDLF